MPPTPLNLDKAPPHLTLAGPQDPLLMPSLLGILPGVCAFGKAQSLKNSIFYIPHLPKWDGEMGLVLLPFSPLKLTLKILFSVHVLWLTSISDVEAMRTLLTAYQQGKVEHLQDL